MKNYETVGDILTAVCACHCKDEADEVIRKVEEDNPGYAKNNIGYIIGYIEPKEERDRVKVLFSDCKHPIFEKEIT